MQQVGQSATQYHERIPSQDNLATEGHPYAQQPTDPFAEPGRVNEFEPTEHIPAAAATATQQPKKVRIYPLTRQLLTRFPPADL